MTRLRTVEPVIVSLGAIAFLALGAGAGAVLIALLFRS